MLVQRVYLFIKRTLSSSAIAEYTDDYMFYRFLSAKPLTRMFLFFHIISRGGVVIASRECSNGFIWASSKISYRGMSSFFFILEMHPFLLGFWSAHEDDSDDVGRLWPSGLSVFHHKDWKSESQICRLLLWQAAVRCRLVHYHAWSTATLYNSRQLQISNSVIQSLALVQRAVNTTGPCSFQCIHTWRMQRRVYSSKAQ